MALSESLENLFSFRQEMNKIWLMNSTKMVLFLMDFMSTQRSSHSTDQESLKAVPATVSTRSTITCLQLDMAKIKSKGSSGIPKIHGEKIGEKMDT